MSYVIAEKQKRVGQRQYYLNISHSGCVTRAEIIYFEIGKPGWRTLAREEGGDAEENILYTWERLKEGSC